VFGINEHFDAAGGSRLPSDEAFSFEGQYHLMDGRRPDAKILLHVGFGRRAAVQARIEVDKRQVLALLGRESFCRATHAALVGRSARLELFPRSLTERSPNAIFSCFSK